MWVKIDDEMTSNRKLRRAGKDAMLLYLAGLCYCGKNETDGFIPDYDVDLLVVLSWVTDAKASIAALCYIEPGDDKYPLWERGEKNGLQGYWVHDYLEYNPTKAKIEEMREKRAAAGERGGRLSGEARRKARDEANAQANGEATTQAKTNPVPRTSYLVPPASGHIGSGAVAPAGDPPADKGKRASKRESRADPRTSSEQIKTAKMVGGGYNPPKPLYDDIIRILGDDPDIERLKACRKTWVEKGKPAGSWEWLTIWYVSGIPGNGANGARGSPPSEPKSYAELRRFAEAKGLANGN